MKFSVPDSLIRFLSRTWPILAVAFTLFVVGWMPEEVDAPSFLTPYSKNMKFIVLSSGFYLILSVTTAKYISNINSNFRIGYVILFLVFFYAVRIASFQNGMYNNDHPDYQSWVFANHFTSLLKIKSAFDTAIAKNLTPIFAENGYMATAWQEHSYGRTLFIVPSVLIGATSFIAFQLAEMVGYGGSIPSPQWGWDVYREFGRFIMPATNYLFMVFLLVFGARYVFERPKTLPLAITAAGLAFVPAHIFISSTISYNLFSDGFSVLLIIANLKVFEILLKIQNRIGNKTTSSLSRKDLSSLIRRCLLYSFSLALFLGTKWAPHVFILILGLQVCLLVARLFFLELENKRILILLAVSIPFFMVGGGVMFYLLLIFRDLIHDLNGMTSFLNGFFVNLAPMPLEGILNRFILLLEVNLAPNIGWVNIGGGILGYLMAVFLAFRTRALVPLLAHGWSGLILAQSLFSALATFGHGSMTRNTLLMGIFIVYSAYFFGGVILKLVHGMVPQYEKITKSACLLVAFLPVFAAGAGFLIFTTSTSPRQQAKPYLLQQLALGRTITTIFHPGGWWYPFWPEMEKLPSSQFISFDHRKIIESPKYWEQRIIDANADIWVLSSHDFFFLPVLKEKNRHMIVEALNRNSYERVSRNSVYETSGGFIVKYIARNTLSLLAGPDQSGLWSPDTIEVFSRKNSHR